MDNDEIKLLWDINIQYDNVVEARTPDIIVVSKKENKCIIVDIAILEIVGYMKGNFKKSKNIRISSRPIRRMWSVKIWMYYRLL